jgi:hypothetical protein
VIRSDEIILTWVVIFGEIIVIKFNFARNSSRGKVLIGFVIMASILIGRAEERRAEAPSYRFTPVPL